MSRGYPKFLFSNPQNSKTKGPFIISTIEPFIICRVHKTANIDQIPDRIFFHRFGDITVEFLRLLFNPPQQFSYGDKVQIMLDKMAEWMHYQLAEGHIKDWE